jgi:hypothetical protein
VIRSADALDSEAIFSILCEVACRVPVDLSTPERVRALKSQINDCCREDLSFVAVDENGAVVAFQLAKRICYLGDTYIHLTYAAVTAAASGNKVFRQFHLHTAAAEPMAQRPDHQCDRASARGVQATDQDADGAIS